MIKLVCIKCNKAWYTANTTWYGQCEACDGELEEENLILIDKGKSDIKNVVKEIASSSE